MPSPTWHAPSRRRSARAHFLRAGPPRFAFLDFLATFNLPIGSIKTRHHTAAAYLNFADHLIDIAIGIIPSIVATLGHMRPNQYQLAGGSGGLKIKTTIAIYCA